MRVASPTLAECLCAGVYGDETSVLRIDPEAIHADEQLARVLD
jgi:hypothetical protein